MKTAANGAGVHNPAQLEAWPELRENERLNRALKVACDRATYLVRQSWPQVNAANKAQLEYIVVAAVSAFHSDMTARE